MTSIDAQDLPTDRSQWSNRGDRYRLGQYGISCRDGRYDTYCIVNGKGYRTGGGFDSFAKSVSHIKGLTSPEDVTERHYTDGRGLEPTDEATGTESFAKYGEGWYNEPIPKELDSVLDARYGGAATAIASRLEDIDRMAADGECEKAAHAALFAVHGGPLPDFMYDSQYGKNTLNELMSKLSSQVDNPVAGKTRGTLSEITWPMRTMMSLMSAAIHTQVTGERRAVSFYDLLPPNQSGVLHNMFNLLDAKDDYESGRRAKGEEYIATMYDPKDGHPVDVRVNDYVISKALQQSFPSGRPIPDHITPNLERANLSVIRPRDIRLWRDFKNKLAFDWSGLPRDYITPAMYNQRAGGGRVSKGGGMSRTAMLADGLNLNPNRIFIYGADGKYGWGIDDPDESSEKRYKSLLARRAAAAEMAETYSTDPEISKKVLEQLSEKRKKHEKELQDADANIDDLKAQLTAVKHQKEDLGAQLKELRTVSNKPSSSKVVAEERKARIKELKEKLDSLEEDANLLNNRLTIGYRDRRQAARSLRAVKDDISNYDTTANELARTRQSLDREIGQLEEGDESVKRFNAENPNYKATALEAKTEFTRNNTPIGIYYLEALVAAANQSIKAGNTVTFDQQRKTDYGYKDLELDDLNPKEIFYLNDMFGKVVLEDPKYILGVLDAHSGYKPQEHINEIGEIYDLRHDPDEMLARYLRMKNKDADSDAIDAARRYVMANGELGAALNYKAVSNETDPVKREEDLKRKKEINAEHVKKVKDDIKGLSYELQELGIDAKDLSKYMNQAKGRKRISELGGFKQQYMAQRHMVNQDIKRLIGLWDGTSDRETIRQLKRMMVVSNAYFGGRADFDDPDEAVSDKPILMNVLKNIDPKTGELNWTELSTMPHDRTSTDRALKNIANILDPGAESHGDITEEELRAYTGDGRGKAKWRYRRPVRLGYLNKLIDRDTPALRMAQEPAEEASAEVLPEAVEAPEFETPGPVAPPETGDAGEAVEVPDKDPVPGAAPEEYVPEPKGEQEEPELEEVEEVKKSARSSNDSRRGMSFREVMGEAASKREKEQGLPVWTDMAGVDMRGCDVWKDMWRTVYMQSGDGTPTQVKMKIIRDE